MPPYFYLLLLHSPGQQLAKADCVPEKKQIYKLLQEKYPQLCAADSEQPVALSYFENDLHKLNPAYTLSYLTALEAKELVKPELKQAFPTTCRHVLSFLPCTCQATWGAK